MRTHHDLPAGLDPVSYYMGAIEAFCEMIAGGLKAMALSAPLDPDLAAVIRDRARQSADKYGLLLAEEDHFPPSDLTPEESTRGKSLFIFFKNEDTLSAFLEAKDRASKGIEIGADLRRLLGYPD